MYTAWLKSLSHAILFYDRDMCNSHLYKSLLLTLFGGSAVNHINFNLLYSQSNFANKLRYHYGELGNRDAIPLVFIYEDICSK